MDWVIFDVGGWHRYPLSNFPESALVYPVHQFYRVHVLAPAGTFLDFLFFVFFFPRPASSAFFFLSSFRKFSFFTNFYKISVPRSANNATFSRSEPKNPIVN
jgi:hypothetical protein